MAWEDDLTYLKILLFSISAGVLVKRLPDHLRNVVCSILGFSTCLIVCGWQILYSLVSVAGTLLILSMIRNKQFAARCCFAYCFAWLAVCRSALYLGLPEMLPHANAVQLIMTLRTIGLAFEVADEMVSLKVRSLFMYCYSYIGLFTGPYVSCRVHIDMCRNRYLSSVPCLEALVQKLIATTGYACLFLVLSHAVDVNDAHEHLFYNEHSLVSRVLFMVAVFTLFRLRVYVAWTLAEAACVTSGLGAYPIVCEPKIGSGPINLKALRKLEHNGDMEKPGQVKYSFEAIRNIDVWGCEFAPTFRDGMRSWNRSVQYWLATYVYRRCPRSSRTFLTMLASAYWHGIHPGYYLSFLTIPLCTAVEDRLQPRRWEGGWKLLWWVMVRRGLEYMAIGFLLLRFDSTMTFWSSIYFFPHVIFIVLLVKSYVMPSQLYDDQSSSSSSMK